jgi:ATP-binding cassette subfamily F protein 3
MKLQKLKERCQSIEEAIADAESDVASLEAELAAFKSVDETVRLTRTLEARREELEALMSEWEELSVAIENA